MVFTPDHVRRMEALLKEKDVVTGLCVMSFPGYPPSVFDEHLMPIEHFPDGLFEVTACGAAFLGISKKVLSTLTEPFTPIFNEKYGQFYGEDISFCMRARQAGFHIWADS